MAYLIRDDLFEATLVVHIDVHSRFQWICISHTNHTRHHQRDIFIVACYFPFAFSRYAIHSVGDRDPFLDLQEYIFMFMAMGDIII